MLCTPQQLLCQQHKGDSAAAFKRSAQGLADALARPPPLPLPSPSLPQLGFLYLRYVCDPRNLWNWFQGYIDDKEVRTARLS